MFNFLFIRFLQKVVRVLGIQLLLYFLNLLLSPI